MTIHETMMRLYNIGMIIRQYLAMESLWARQWKVYEHNNDEIGEMGNVSLMFHIFGSMLLMCQLLISMVFDAFVLEIDVF
jgi:hypothetical protein